MVLRRAAGTSRRMGASTLRACAGLDLHPAIARQAAHTRDAAATAGLERFTVTGSSFVSAPRARGVWGRVTGGGPPPARGGRPPRDVGPPPPGGGGDPP